MEDQSVHIVGDIGQGQFRLGPRQANRADEQPVAILLAGEDMLDPGADARLLAIGAGCGLWHRPALGFAAMDLAAQHLACQPCLICLRTVGAVRPYIAARVIRGHDLAQHSPIALRRGRHRAIADKAILAVDGDVRLVAEGWDRNHWQRRSVRAVADLAADLQGPSRICIFLGRLVGFIWPYLIGLLPGFDRRLLRLRVPLLRRRDQGGVHDLARHGDVALLPQLPIEGLHCLAQRSGLGQLIAKQADRVLIRRWGAQIEPQEPHPRQPVPNHELHTRVREIMLRLQDQRLEHRHRFKRRATALGAVAIAETFNQPPAEILEIDRRIEDLKRIAVLAEQRKMIRKTEKTAGIHDRSSFQSVNHITPQRARLMRVSSFLLTQDPNDLVARAYVASRRSCSLR